jgi:hypothetical protein
VATRFLPSGGHRFLPALRGKRDVDGFAELLADV